MVFLNAFKLAFNMFVCRTVFTLHFDIRQLNVPDIVTIAPFVYFDKQLQQKYCSAVKSSLLSLNGFTTRKLQRYNKLRKLAFPLHHPAQNFMNEVKTVLVILST